MATIEQKGRLNFKAADGNLYRLAIEPSAHASTHAKGGADPITAESIGAVSQIKNINPETTGHATLLSYMASLYARDTIVVGNVTGFSDLPDGGSGGHAYISTIGGIMTVILITRTVTWFRGTNSLTSWTNTWRKVYDEGNLPTPLSLGAVAKAGDTMTGPLTFSNLSDYYAFTKARSVGDGKTNFMTMGIAYGGNVVLEHYTGNSTDFSKAVLDGRLELGGGVGTNTYVLTLRPDSSSSQTYRIFGEHNLPSVRENLFTAGTTDLTPGSSPLESGKLYFVYE